MLNGVKIGSILYFDWSGWLERLTTIADANTSRKHIYININININIHINTEIIDVDSGTHVGSCRVGMYACMYLCIYGAEDSR